MEERLMNLEPCAERAAGVAHTPPLDRQASWHQCLTECRRVEDNPSTECAERVKKKEENNPCLEPRSAVLQLLYHSRGQVSAGSTITREVAAGSTATSAAAIPAIPASTSY